MQAAITSMRKNTNGFSLIEVMVVLFMIGLSVAVVVLNYSGSDFDKELQKKARRFQIVFDMASDYAVLNQVQLGLRIEPEKNQYFFMFLNDEDKWRPIQGEDLFAVQEFEQEYSLELELDDLPWVQEDSLFDADIFDEELSVSEESTEIGKEEEQEPEPPQVFIFSSGDFTPFSLIFKFEPQFGDAFPVYFRVNGEEYTPLIVEGPLDSL